MRSKDIASSLAVKRPSVSNLETLKSKQGRRTFFYEGHPAALLASFAILFYPA